MTTQKKINSLMTDAEFLKELIDFMGKQAQYHTSNKSKDPVDHEVAIQMAEVLTKQR